MPKATKKKIASKTKKLPTSGALAAFVGVPLAPPLRVDQTRRLLKPYPGFRAILDNVAANLREDNDVLELTYDPDDIEQRLEEANQLDARNRVLREVLDGSDGLRQSEDSFLMKVLFDSVKRVHEQSRVHPELLARWQPILDFVRKNRPGRGPSKSSAIEAAPSA